MGDTDKYLTQNGIAQVSRMAMMFVGHGNVLDPSRVACAFISPMTRTRKTCDLLLRTSSITNTVYNPNIKSGTTASMKGLPIGKSGV
jgi:phosphohistidine phosphatase SixA